MSSESKAEPDRIVLPLHAEEISVSRRKVTGDTIRVGTRTTEREHVVDEPLTHERVETTRVPVGRVVTEAPPVRQEGDTIIVPIVEEMIVIERRLILKEEVHVRRVRETGRHREVVTVRKQEAVITRIAGDEEKDRSPPRM